MEKEKIKSLEERAFVLLKWKLNKKEKLPEYFKLEGVFADTLNYVAGKEYIDGSFSITDKGKDYYLENSHKLNK
jgi:hypothetical protein